MMALKEEVVIVGKKPLMNYVLSIIVMFNQGVENIIVKGRGNDISKAVDIVNTVLSRLGDAIKISSIEIGSETRKGKLVSFINIKLERTL